MHFDGLTNMNFDTFLALISIVTCDSSNNVHRPVKQKKKEQDMKTEKHEIQIEKSKLKYSFPL